MSVSLTLNEFPFQSNAGIAPASDCCAGACPVRGVDSCGTMMEDGESGRIATTAAVISFKVPPVRRLVVPADDSAAPFRVIAQSEIELDALAAAPPIDLLNAHFLI